MTLKTTPFDIVDFIAEPENAVEYLKVVMENGNSDEIRAAVYKALGEKGNPTLFTRLALTIAIEENTDLG